MEPELPQPGRLLLEDDELLEE
ncbi:MAG: hypothetical protein QOE95_1576, partial [Gaiellaceae bacterium]|nr:hypothetical protein [Gaiellaceae bacterium]